MNEMFVGTPCTSSRSYYIVPRKNVRVDLEKVSEKLSEIGWTIKKRSKGIVIAEKEYTIAVFPSGKILIRDILDEEVAKKIAEEVFPKVMECKIETS